MKKDNTRGMKRGKEFKKNDRLVNGRRALGEKTSGSFLLASERLWGGQVSSDRNATWYVWKGFESPLRYQIVIWNYIPSNN